MESGRVNAPFAPPPTVLTVATLTAAADWDAFAASAPAATPFHSRAWCEAVAAATGHACLPLAVRDAAGRVVGLLPLHHIRSPLFGQALVSSGFAVGGGICASDPAAHAALAGAATDLAARLGVGSVELRGGAAPAGAGWSVEDATYAGFARNLAADDDAELLAVPRKQRAEVRKALDSGLTVTTGSGAAERADHYHVYATSVRNLGTPVFARALFDAVLDHCGPAGADILTVRADGRAIASVLSLYWRGTVLPYWGGGLAEARGNRANERMYFALMAHARARGCTRFDFGRSKVGTGPFAYKKNWGFDPEPLAYGRWLAPGEAPRDTNPNSAKYRMQVNLWKRLPLWLANLAGPFIARGLG